MAIKITSIDELTAEQVSQLQAEFSQIVQEKYPEISLTTGGFHDLVAYFAGGISGAINQATVDRLVRSGSLLEITKDPALADDELVDRVLSNYRITRKQGTRAVGEISITVSSDITVIIPSGLVFSASGVDFVVDNAFTARPPGSVISAENERLLQPLGNGQYTFAISATASSEGTAGNIRRGTRMVPTAPPQNYVNSVAATDFRGGFDTELNEDLLTRLQEGIAAKVMQGRVNITALLKEQPQFSNTLNYSVIGYGNAEMFRDQHSLFPISSGGRLDIYARTAQLPQTITLLKEAVLVGTEAAGTLWQFAIQADDAPGFYEVEQIIKPDDPIDTAGFTVVSDIRGLDLPTTFAPDLLNTLEGAYTRYQTAVIRFLDTTTPLGSLTVGSSRANYSVAVTAMPLLAELQDFCLNADVRNLASDVAVKAAVPCFLSINFNIEIAAGTPPPDTAAIGVALEERINKLGFPGRLHASLIANTVHAFLHARQAVGTIEMHGRIRAPGGHTVLIRANDVLRIPDDPGNLVTGRTTVFILDKLNVGISVVTSEFTLGV